MGEIKFTEQQQSVIRTSDKNILVSAAARAGVPDRVCSSDAYAKAQSPQIRR